MQSSRTFKEWYQHASQADVLQGLNLWRTIETTSDYDYRLIRARLDSLRSLPHPSDDPQVMFLLRAGMIRNLGGICNVPLYRVARAGTKVLIEEYIEETKRQLERIVRSEHPEIGRTTKADFFGDLTRSFGRTALVLYGGASFGLCHLGVAKCLFEEGLLPKILCGSYIGALMAAAICVQDEKGLHQLLSGDVLQLAPLKKPGGMAGSVVRKLFRLIRYGCLLDVRILEDTARKNIGDITFKEAFVKSGRVLNIVVQSKRKHEIPVLLNYITAPDVIVWSAACASCAVPGLYESVTLLSKCPDTGGIRLWHPNTIRMESASVSTDIPTVRLAELFNVNNFIVSQVPSYFSIQISPSDEADRSSPSVKAIRLIGDELAHCYCQAKEFGLIPDRLVYFERFFHAPLPGNITLSPSIHFSDITHIVRNPTKEFVQYCLKKGERCAWKRMAQLRIRSTIEYHMEWCLNEARKSELRRPLQTPSIETSLGDKKNGLKWRAGSFKF